MITMLSLNFYRQKNLLLLKRTVPSQSWMVPISIKKNPLLKLRQISSLQPRKKRTRENPLLSKVAASEKTDLLLVWTTSGHVPVILAALLMKQQWRRMLYQKKQRQKNHRNHRPSLAVGREMCQEHSTRMITVLNLPPPSPPLPRMPRMPLLLSKTGIPSKRRHLSPLMEEWKMKAATIVITTAS